MSEAVPEINEKLKALIEPLEHLTTSIKEYTGSQSADASVTVSPVTEQSAPVVTAAAEAEARKAAQEAAGSEAPEASGSAAPDAAVQAVPGANQEEKAAQAEAERLEAEKAAQEASGSAQVAAGSAQEAAGSAQAEAEKLKAAQAEEEKLKAAQAEEEKLKKAEEEKLEADRLAAQGAQEASGSAPDAAAQAEASSIDKTTAIQVDGTTLLYGNIMQAFENMQTGKTPNRNNLPQSKLDEVYNKLKTAKTTVEVQNILREHNFAMGGTTPAKRFVQRVVGGTRKPRMHRRKKTQRKRSKTIKKKNRAGNRK